MIRENTRCDVDEPMSTPTESTHNSSSSPNVRPVEEKKTRPPWDSSVMMRHARPCAGHPRLSFARKSWMAGTSPAMTADAEARSFLRQQAAIIALVIFRPHPVRCAFLLHLVSVFLTQEWIFHVVGDRGAAFRNVHGCVVGVLLAGRAGLASGIVRAKPRGEPERFLGRA